MSLTATDLKAIRTILKEEVREEMQKVVREDVRQIVYGVVHGELNSLEGKVTALENDVKAIYFILAKLEKNIVIADRQFQKLSIEDKLLKINAELLEAAKQAGITLPR